MSNFSVRLAGHTHVKMWDKGIIHYNQKEQSFGRGFERGAVEQLDQVACLPFMKFPPAAMPDTHQGMGGPVGLVLALQGVIVPALVGVDIGCGMMAQKTTLRRQDLEECGLPEVRRQIERAVPAGRTNNGGQGDRGAWHDIPAYIKEIWDTRLLDRFDGVCITVPGMRKGNNVNHLGTLGTGNHFIELATAETILHEPDDYVWIVLHSGSRGPGNKIGAYYTRRAKELCAEWFIKLPAPDLAYLPQCAPEYHGYLSSVKWAQDFALLNRTLMMEAVKKVLAEMSGWFTVTKSIQCHHNYINFEKHFGQVVAVTRKGAVKADVGDLAIIPGSMGARTYVVEGLGSQDSYHSCSHGAGRMMSRTAAARMISVEEHVAATEGVECLKDASVIDESPAAYKDIDTVIEAESDLVKPVEILKQFLCVKGASDNRHD